MQDHRLLIVTDGLIASDESVVLHPELFPWRKQLDASARKWFDSAAATPLEWYAALNATTPASLASMLFPPEITSGYSQIWIASPFHARLMRDRLQVMPDALYPWHDEDSGWLCELLNPLLAEDGMQLIHNQVCMALLSRERIDASPCSFATVSGDTLPNRHPEGADGGRLMRLLSEIQMLLRMHPCPHRRERGEPDVDGLWLWGGGDITPRSGETPFPVVSRNPWLRQLADSRDAKVMIGEAEHLATICKGDAPLPARIVLAGGEHAVLLRRSALPRFGKAAWRPAGVKASGELLHRLRGFLNAA